MISSNACGKHFFCSNCWIIYIHISINDSGPGCLNLSCLTPPQARKWCVGPGCDFVVQYEYYGGDENLYDVTCDCSNKFYWNCTKESHRTVDCKTVEERKSVAWILANTKACPKCKRAIEKNEGCNRMTCISPCLFEFCWACLGPFKDNHVCSTTTDYTTGTITNDEKINREKVVHSEKTTPRSYYERWTYYDRLMKRDQIFECRRVLKWSYAYGYYMPENEKWKKNFFEYLLKEAESALKSLRLCAEQ
ncbi:hypothetical protein ACJIZ3_006028 [Penstemon smallii]|uniref:RBR-type E3 ubiquitin transferase n=1 Tax=Penstemon smallii TaxID=265156 RepID=A0ABD3S6Z6_9LAMI